MQVVIDVAKHHKSVYVVAFIALILQAAVSVYVLFPPYRMVYVNVIDDIIIYVVGSHSLRLPR